MNPYPGDNSVIIMDNAKIHHDSELVALIEGLGCHVVFFHHIPPISIRLKLHFQPLNHGLNTIVIIL